jgi:hypothetical protein
MFHRLMALILLVGMASSLSSQSPISHVDIFKGECGPNSKTAEGPLNSDLSNRTSRFFCDEAVIFHFGDSGSHILIDFMQKDSRPSSVIGFSGDLSDGVGMRVENYYFMSGEPTVVSDGSCQLFFANHQIAGIDCEMTVDGTGRRPDAKFGSGTPKMVKNVQRL